METEKGKVMSSFSEIICAHRKLQASEMASAVSEHSKSICQDGNCSYTNVV